MPASPSVCPSVAASKLSIGTIDSLSLSLWKTLPASEKVLCLQCSWPCNTQHLVTLSSHFTTECVLLINASQYHVLWSVRYIVCQVWWIRTLIVTSRSACPASRVSTLNEMGRLAGTPSGRSPTPDSATLRASTTAGWTFVVNGLPSTDT